MIDTLTGLATRAAFLEGAERWWRDGCSAGVALVLVDLEDFADVNERVGFAGGDVVLATLARRIASTVRAEELVARVGDDEFGVLLQHADRRTAELVAERIRERIVEPITVGDEVVRVRATIATELAVDRDNVELLLRRADAALRDSRRCMPADADASPLHRRIASTIGGALERGELRIVYQPQVNLATSEMTGVEALLRWRSPELGDVSPAVFVPVAEATGAIVHIGAWVLEQACHRVQQWSERFHSAGRLDLHVNLSPRQFADPDLDHMVCEVLGRSGLAPERLCLEVTETAVIDRVNEAAETLRRFRRQGVRVAIDDFGVGYSSLSYLRRLPADVLKLDKSFIENLGVDAADTAIVVAIVNLARALGLVAVAEGVETDRQRRELRAIGCKLAQGFYFAKPLEVSELEGFVAAPRF